jgi:hypothetical protein
MMARAEPVFEEGAPQGARPSLREVAGRVTPLTLAGERLVPVVPELSAILPDGGLRRGSTVAVHGVEGAGVTSLALLLAAGASRAGGWCAAVGMPSLGLAAAAEAGIELARFPLVAAPPAREWATITAALLDAMDIVLAWSPNGRVVRATDARRLQARARERGAVAVLVGTRPIEGADLRLAVAGSRWHGLGDGHGHLAARELDVVVGGRGAAARERRAVLSFTHLAVS